MLENLPIYIPVTFGLTTIVTLFLFHRMLANSKSPYTKKHLVTITIGLIVWLIIQAVLTLKDVYNFETDSFPPTILLFGILPPLLTIIILFLTEKGKQLIDSLPLTNITYLNIVRIPVEIVLFWLFLNKTVPELMTFQGRNFDIIAGITAPIVAYFWIVKEKNNRKKILIWNFIGLGLLINIAINAFLSAPTPIQQFGSEQPNIAILNFPFSWLPTFVVPVILFGHLVSIRQLVKD